MSLITETEGNEPDSLPPVALPESRLLSFLVGFVAIPGLPAMPMNYSQTGGKQ